MQLLYVANRYERKPDLQRWLDGGLILVCDRYLASSIAYGEAQGLDPLWLAEMQKFLPRPSLTFMLDIAPETAVQRKAVDRDRYERDLEMQMRVRGQLPTSGGRRAMGRARWRALQAGDCCRRLQRGDVTTRAAVRARTSRDPGRFQHSRTRLQRRARRADVVDKHHDLSLEEPRRTRWGKRVPNVLMPPGGW